MSVKYFNFVKGFSNQFWGWGGEDDDMAMRLRNKNLTFQTTGNQAQIRFEADTPLILPKGSSAIGGVSAEEALARGISM